MLKEGVAQKTSRKWLGAEPELSNRAAPETKDDTVMAWHGSRDKLAEGCLPPTPNFSGQPETRDREDMR